MQRDKIVEECAVFGVCLCIEEAAGITYNGLLALQHRGQESAGIAVVLDGKIICRKGTGFVNEVFSQNKLEVMPKGKIAIGHNRYSTTGSSTEANAGPFVTEYLTGRIATAHNGNITNAKEIRQRLTDLGIKFDATSDSEVISSLIAYYITNQEDIESAVLRACNSLSGAFSLIIAGGERLIAVRDPDGYRPLCIGQSEAGCAVASESCALDACGFKFLRDILPGEIVVIENGRIVSEGTRLAKRKSKGGLCIFEYVYFSRPDSVIDGLSVYEARVKMGQYLAEEHPANADIVCGVPDSGLEAAAGFASKSGLSLVSGFVKNRYVGRSFIYPVQSQRENIVRLKLNPLPTVKGKRVVLVDDSIVRGTTSEKIIKSLKDRGAAEVHMRISSPPFLHACHYGTDIDSEEKLIANQMSMEEIRRKIGADSLGYISIEALKKSCEKCRISFCTECFTGNSGVNQKKDILE